MSAQCNGGVSTNTQDNATNDLNESQGVNSVNLNNGGPSYAIIVPTDPGHISMLEPFIQSHEDGRLLLLAQKHHGKLESRHRSRLVKVIIAFELSLTFQKSELGPDKLSTFSISPERFQALSKEITRLFPNEKTNVYYVPYSNDDNKKIGAYGKLLDHFKYMKCQLRKDGIIVGRKKTTTQNEDVDDVDSVDNSNDNGEGIVDVVELNEWLKSHIEPRETVEDCWKKTYNYRKKMLKKNIAMSEYLKLYPILDLDFAVTLIKHDFEVRYKNKVAEFFSIWLRSRDNLLLKLTDPKVLSQLSESARVALFKISQLPEAGQDALLILILPYLIKPLPIKRDCRGASKQSGTEQQKSFIKQFTTANDINLDLNSLAVPNLVCVGSASDIHSFYVAFNGKHYKCDTSLDALSFAFQLFWVLDIDYPAASKNVWLLIQLFYFNIPVPSKVKVPTTVNNLIADLTP